MLPDGSEICFSGEKQREIVPVLCKNESHELLLDRRAFTYLVSEIINSWPAPTTYTHAVLVFRPGGAEQYFQDLRFSIASCAPRTQDGIRIKYMPATGPELGQGSVYLAAEYRHPQPLEGGMPQVQVFRISAVKVGESVSVIYDGGWEGVPSLGSTLADATERAAVLL